MTKICKILLVEDQREIQELLCELFASEGYHFLIVGDGPAMREALEQDSGIDVVIIDMLLPGGLDGLTLAQEARAHGLPVILVTGDHQQAEVLEASGHRYLLKPFGLGGFIALIDQVLSETHARCVREARAGHGGADYGAPGPTSAGAQERAARA